MDFGTESLTVTVFSCPPTFGIEMKLGSVTPFEDFVTVIDLILHFSPFTTILKVMASPGAAVIAVADGSKLINGAEQLGSQLQEVNTKIDTVQIAKKESDLKDFIFVIAYLYKIKH